MASIICLTKKREKFQWIKECNKAFHYIRDQYVNASILIGDNKKIIFFIHNYTSNLEIDLAHPKSDLKD